MGSVCPLPRGMVADPPHEPDPALDSSKFLGNRWVTVRVCRRCGAFYAEPSPAAPRPDVEPEGEE